MASNERSLRLKIPLLKCSIQMQTTEQFFSVAGAGRATPELPAARDVTTDQAEAAMTLTGNPENTGNSTKGPQVFEPARNAPWRYASAMAFGISDSESTTSA